MEIYWQPVNYTVGKINKIMWNNIHPAWNGLGPCENVSFARACLLRDKGIYSRA